MSDVRPYSIPCGGRHVQLFIPFTVGGGIRTLEDAAAVFSAGADKISINSAALADPTLITQHRRRALARKRWSWRLMPRRRTAFALGSIHAWGTHAQRA